MAALDDMGQFAAELGIGQGGGGGGGDGTDSYEDWYISKDDAWAAYNKAAVSGGDDSKTIQIRVLRFLRFSAKGKSAAQFVDLPGKPSAMLALLKSLEGSDITAPRFQLSEFDSPYVQDHMVPYLQEKAKTHTIILAGPSGVNKTEFARVLHGPSHHVGDVDQLKEVNLDCTHIVFNDFDFSSIGVGDRKVTEQDLLHLFEVDENNEDSHSVNARQASAKISIRAKKTFTTNKSEPFCREFWKCDVDADHIEAIKGRVVWIDLHDFQGFAIVPWMSFEAKEAFEAANPSARINEYQCWPLHLPDICYPHPNAEAAADVDAVYVPLLAGTSFLWWLAS